jgi:chromosome segregation ATPase
VSEHAPECAIRFSSSPGYACNCHVQRIADLERRLVNLREYADSLHREKKDLERELQQRIADLEQQVQSACQALQDEENEVERLERENAELNEKIKKSIAGWNKSIEQCERLEGENAELKTDRDNFKLQYEKVCNAAWKVENHRAQGIIERLERELQEAREELKEHQDSLRYLLIQVKAEREKLELAEASIKEWANRSYAPAMSYVEKYFANRDKEQSK